MTGDSYDATPTLADDALLAAFRETDDPVLTTGEVHESVPFGRIPAEEGLDRLATEGVLERKTVGDETVWWLPGHTETDSQREPMAGATREDRGGLPPRIENTIATLETPDEPERAAIYATCFYLWERGPASPEVLREEVYPEHDAGYESPEEWWATCVRPALAALPGVTRDDDGESEGDDGDRWRIE